MIKLLLFTLLTCSLHQSFAQDVDTLYEYSFQISGIDNPANAKHVIHELRSPIGQKLITFNDDTDTFLLKSTVLFIEEELYNLIEQNGYTIIQ